MPAKSEAQRRLMAIAEHHPEELYERNKGAAEMTHKQLHEFASTSEKGLPEHVKKREEGGPVEPGEKYLVGEKGPEILEMEKSGRITPTTIVHAPYQLAHAMRKGEKGGSVEGE